MKRTCKICGAPTRGDFCREHRKQYQTAYFQEHVVAKSATASQRKRQLLDWYRSLKHMKPCNICGFTGDECQMDFDHVPGRGKFMEVSRMVRLGYEREKIEREINRCQLLCSNCHRLITKERRHRI